MAEDPSELDALLRMSMRVTAVVTAVGSARGLSLSQMRIFAVLRDHQPTMGELAAHLGVDPSSVSGLIDRAAAWNLVERIAHDDDRRVVRVALTPAGRAFAADVEAELAAEVAPLLAQLDARERERLHTILSRALAR